MTNLPTGLSGYGALIKTLRASLTDETDCLYYLHSPLGTINVSRFDYPMPGVVAITGDDESKETRFVVFSEEEIRSFPLEVRRKSLEDSKERVGFRPWLQGGADDKA
jgi:hypothetical protein